MSNIDPTRDDASCPPQVCCYTPTTATRRGNGNLHLKSRPSTYAGGWHLFCPLCGSSRYGYSPCTRYSSSVS
jgi:hypothetical protein